MNRTKSTQIIMPNIAPPPTRAPLTRKAGIPLAWSRRTTTARMTGPPTTSAMKMVRFDQSISPSESSKTRVEAAMNDGARRSVMWLRFHQVLEDGLQVVVG